MRSVDTAALEAVARSLGVGNPATATADVEFDDAHLQQTYDVGPLIRNRSARQVGSPRADGFFTFTVEENQVGAGTGQAGGSVHDVLLANGLIEAADIVWVYDVTAYISTTALTDFLSTVFRIELGANNQLGPGNSTGHVLFTGDDYPGGSSSQNVIPITATTGYVRNTSPNLGPWPMGPEASWDGWVNVAAGSCVIEWNLLCRVFPAGVPPII